MTTRKKNYNYKQKKKIIKRSNKCNTIILPNHEFPCNMKMFYSKLLGTRYLTVLHPLQLHRKPSLDYIWYSIKRTTKQD